jgi:plasmid stabilization system protein ParE
VTEALFHPEAAAEYADAIRWYDERSQRAASRFEMEVERVVDLISTDPEAFARYDDVHRFTLVRRFPYSVVYRILSGRPYIVAVAHSSRAPGYWRHRT